MFHKARVTKIRYACLSTLFFHNTLFREIYLYKVKFFLIFNILNFIKIPGERFFFQLEE